MGRNKHNAKKTLVDGILFHSLAESQRYVELKIMLGAGLISNLELQPFYLLEPGRRIAGRWERPITYTADFRYIGADGKTYIEDVKGVKTEPFQLRRKLLLFRYEDKFQSGEWVFRTVHMKTPKRTR